MRNIKEGETNGFENTEPETVDQWMQHISEFTHKWELGSPEHCAVSDFLNLQRLYREFGTEPRGRLAELRGATRLSTENRADRDIQRIALLEHTIERDSARIPEYSNAYVHLFVSFDFLQGAAAKEAQAKLADNLEKQKEYVQEIYIKTLKDAEDDVFEKQNPGY